MGGGVRSAVNRLKRGAQFGGRGGIRTHGTLAGTPVFKTGALNHSATLPAQEFQSLSVGLARTQCERGPDVDPIPSIWRKPSDEGVAFGQARTLHGALHMRWESHGWRHRPPSV